MIKKILLSSLLVLSLSVSTKVYAQETEDKITTFSDSNIRVATGFTLDIEDIKLENYTEYLSLTTYEEKRDFFYNIFFVEWNNLNPRENLDYEVFFLEFLCEELELEEKPLLDNYSIANGTCGYYSFNENIVHLNQFYGYDGTKVFSILCHETRHAWQRQEVYRDTAWGKVFLDNLNGNYYSPDESYEDYTQKNITEADAFVYEHNKLMEYLNK